MCEKTFLKPIQLPQPKDQDVVSQSDLQSEIVVPTHPNSQSNLSTHRCSWNYQEFWVLPKTALDVLVQALGDMPEVLHTRGCSQCLCENSGQPSARKYKKRLRTQSTPSHPVSPATPAQSNRSRPGLSLATTSKSTFYTETIQGNKTSPYLFKNFSIWLYFIFLI